MSKKSRVRIETSVYHRAEEIAASRGLSSATVIDAAIRAGLAEIQSARQYELLPTGILLVRDGGQDAPPASRRNQRASTAGPKPAENRAKARVRAKSNTDSPQTATTAQTQPSVAQSTSHRAQEASEATAGPQTATTAQTQPSVAQSTSHRAQEASEATAGPQTATTAQTQPSVAQSTSHRAQPASEATAGPQTATTAQTQPSVAQSTSHRAQPAPEPATSPQTAATTTPVPPFLTGEMIPADVYESLSEYEKECLSLEAFLLSPDGQVVLRDEPPIGGDGTSIAVGTWAYFHASFIPGDDPDNFVGLTWKIKEK